MRKQKYSIHFLTSFMMICVVSIFFLKKQQQKSKLHFVCIGIVVRLAKKKKNPNFSFFYSEKKIFNNPNRSGNQKKKTNKIVRWPDRLVVDSNHDYR